MYTSIQETKTFNFTVPLHEAVKYTIVKLETGVVIELGNTRR